MRQLVQQQPVSRRSLLAGLAGLAAVPLAACASEDRQTIRPAGLIQAKGVARVVPSASAPVGTVAAGMIAFGHALCAASATPGRNWVASPLSIATAFSMARVGALGATATSLDRFFGYPASGRDEAFNAITRSVATTDGPPPPSPAPPSPNATPAPPVVALGNALFAQHGFALRTAFLETLAAQYGAGVRDVDFTTAAALAQVNAWVSEETAGRIRRLLTSLDPQTQLVIANTVYLRATWAHIFGEYPTAPAPFARAGGSVSVPMMHNVGTWPYASNGGWQALSMPYASGRTDGTPSDLAMWLILPPPGGDPVAMLTPTTLAAVGRSLQMAPVDVTVPKWNFSTTIDLGDVLPAMGLHGVFGTGDFTGIAAGIPAVSSAVHSANITVDEHGTVAAAATALAFASGAMLPPSTVFHADRPFAFTIVGGASHVPLFTGVVADPTG